MQGHEGGYFIGGWLFDNVTPDMKIHEDEIFRPVLRVVRAQNDEDALRLPNEHEYGNGVAIFIRDGDAPRDCRSHLQACMVGVNVSIRFYIKTKTVTSRGLSCLKDGASFATPTME